MIKQVLVMRDLEVRANASQDRIKGLANLLRRNCIGYKMLLRNIVEIVRLDEGLTVDAVLCITDAKRYNAADLSVVDFEDALVAVRCASDLRTGAVLIAAISDVMKSKW
jgi:hypothetical protein